MYLIAEEEDPSSTYTSIFWGFSVVSPTLKINGFEY